MRLHEIEHELCTVLNLDHGALAGADRLRIQTAAVLRLKFELASAQLVGGDAVSGDELMKLAQAADEILPPPVSHPQRLEVVEVSSTERAPPEYVAMRQAAEAESIASSDPVVAELKRRLTELEGELTSTRDEANTLRGRLRHYEFLYPPLKPGQTRVAYMGGPVIEGGGDPITQLNNSLRGNSVDFSPHSNRNW
jgi:hypothetical protein